MFCRASNLDCPVDGRAGAGMRSRATHQNRRGGEKSGDARGGVHVPREPGDPLGSPGRSLSQSQADMGRAVHAPRGLTVSQTLMLLAMKVGKMSMGLPALCQDSRGTKAPRNKVCMSLPAHQLVVPKGFLPCHSLSHLSVSLRALLLSVCVL